MNNTAIVIGDSYSFTSGLSYVAKNLARILKDKLNYKVIYLSITNERHEPVENQVVWIGNCVQELDRQIVKYRPSIVVCNHDPWLLYQVMLSQFRHTFSLIGYIPCESLYYAPEAVTNLPDQIISVGNGQEQRQPGPVSTIPIAQIIQDYDYLIAYNDFGRQGLEGLGAKVRRCIPHGYHRDRVKIIENREVVQGRRHAIGVKDDEILFMHVSRNSVRKRQDVLLEAWYRFMQMGEKKLGHRPKAKLYLHSDQVSFNGFVIPSIINRLKINDSVIMPQNMNFSEEDLNIFMNAADCYITSPAAEGFGLPVLEMMALGKPIVYGNYGGHTTFCEGAGIAVPPVQFISAQNIDMVHAIINSGKMAEAMMTMYLDKDLREKYGKVGIEKAQSMSWDKVDLQFVEAFQEAVSEAMTPFVFAKKVV